MAYNLPIVVININQLKNIQKMMHQMGIKKEDMADVYTIEQIKKWKVLQRKWYMWWVLFDEAPLQAILENYIWHNIDAVTFTAGSNIKCLDKVDVQYWPSHPPFSHIKKISGLE